MLADFHKLAACEPADAIWVVMSRADGHAVLDALNAPIEGPTRVQQTYGENTPPRDFQIDTPGLTAMYTASSLRESLED